MNDPRKHHYNPVFYLSQWTGEDGLVCEFKLVHGKVGAQRRHPKATGFQRDLYQTDGVPAEQAQHVEKTFMSPLDNDAALALQKIVSGDRSDWNGDERTAWTTFLLSLLFRNPENVAVIKDHILKLWEEGKAALEADYVARRRPTDPATFAEFVALTNPAAPQIAASNFLMETISNKQLGPTIFNMHWTRHELTEAKVPTMTSDRPIVMPFGLADRRAYIALPVSPTILFVAAHDTDFAKTVASWNKTKLVKELNKAVVCQARQFVWGTDDSQLDFVRRHIATAPDRIILTEEHRKQALAAARGEVGR